MSDVVFSMYRNGGVYYTFSMVICGNIQVWVLTEDIALPGFHRHMIYMSASAPCQWWVGWQDVVLPETSIMQGEPALDLGSQSPDPTGSCC